MPSTIVTLHHYRSCLDQEKRFSERTCNETRSVRDDMLLNYEDVLRAKVDAAWNEIGKP
jgi:hypothetical protein